jgi:hypothetical protein
VQYLENQRIGEQEDEARGWEDEIKEFWLSRGLLDLWTRIYKTAKWASEVLKIRRPKNPGSSDLEQQRSTYTTKKHYRKFEQIFPEKEMRSLSPNFLIDVSMSYLYIPTIGLPIPLHDKMWTDPGNI